MTLLEFSALFAEFRAPTWDAWRAILARVTDGVREFYAIVGRGAGKSRIVALLACYFASRPYLRAPGERIYVGIFAPDRKQAGITFRYVLGLLGSVPVLSALIVNETRESVELSNGVTIEVITASIGAPRGRAYSLVIIEEAAFLPQDASANPDVELLRAVRPALARAPGSLLAVVSSPYARKGVCYSAWQRYHDTPVPDVVFVQASTLDLNPTFDARAIATAYEDDPASAAAEYGAEFRRDVETYVSREAIVAATVPGRLLLPPEPGEHAFLDFAGGSGQDSATLGIARRVKGEKGKPGDCAVLCHLREWRPPFSPDAMAHDAADILRERGLSLAVGDKFAGDWPREALGKYGVTYEASALPKSDLYREFLPALNSGRVELLDQPRLLAQLAALERRTGRGGRDTIDHPPQGHDDLINAACGALLLALGVGRACEVRVW